MGKSQKNTVEILPISVFLSKFVATKTTVGLDGNDAGRRVETYY